MIKSKWLAASVAALIVFGCASQKEPAEQAVANVDAALQATHDAAAKYAPEGLQSVEAQVATLKDNLSRGDYKKVLADAPTVSAAVANLQQAAIKNQEDADTKLAKTKQQWRTLSAEVPKMVTAIQARVDELAKSRRLPKGVTKASFESAKASLESLKSTWAEAASAVASQDYAGGVAKGQAAKDKATEIMQELSVTSSRTGGT
jgi:hypothetical protein